MADDIPDRITFVLSSEQQSARSGVFTGGPHAPATPHAPLMPELAGTIKASVKLGAVRGKGDQVRVDAIPGEDVVVMQIANGPVLVLHPEAARDLLLAQTDIKRMLDAEDEPLSAPDEVEVPNRLHWEGLEQATPATRSSTRGAFGDVLLSAFQVVTGNIKDKAATFAATRVVEHVDSQVVEGLYALQPESLHLLSGNPTVSDTDVSWGTVAKGAPILVLLHGTFSNTWGTFQKLWTQHPQRVATMFQSYGGHVYGLDHHTLGASPIGNALTLAKALPAGARLHLLTHSRGGLVAEVMARVCGLAKGADAASELFDGADHADQQRQLGQLVKLVRDKNITVDRVVRVACPSRGTLLASKRLDAYVSVFKWTLELAGLHVIPELIDFLGAVAQRRADVATIPGLQAQVPDSPLIQWLHTADEPLPGQLRVVAGDLQADSIASWFKTLLSDSFYWTDNDLVVQTSSMYGGVPRKGGASFLLDAGGKVSHFNYFTNDRTADAIVNALVQDDPLVFKQIGPLSYAGESSDGTRASRVVDDGVPPSEKPAVFLLPGILGSNLAVNGKRIWLGWRLINGLTSLEYNPLADTSTVTPDGPIGMSYDDLTSYLSATHEVIQFAFDWRKPMEQEARRLGTAVEAALAARAHSGQAVRMVAHSMGGLLARTMQLECGPIWDRMMSHQSARLLMLGTPNAGSWAPMQVLSGDDTFGNTLVAFGAPFRDAEARNIMAQFPGFIQLQAGLRDDKLGLTKSETWKELATRDYKQSQEHNWWHKTDQQKEVYKWGIPGDAVLAAALALRIRLDAQRDNDLPKFADKLKLVVGKARFTPDGYALGDDGLSYVNAPGSGDGRVTLGNAWLPGVRTWFLDCEHGKLADDEAGFPALLELLTTGATSLLPLQARPVEATLTAAAAATRGAAQTATMAHVLSRPSRLPKGAQPPGRVDDMQRLMPDESPARPPEAGGALRINVVNGDVKFVRQPLLIGHYQSLKLTGSESVMDKLVGGTMRESLAIGRYPDVTGTLQIFANTNANFSNPLQLPRPEAVIVVGLGPEGELRGSQLVHSIRQAVIAWAQKIVEQPFSQPPVFELAATLIGSGGTGVSAGQAAQWISQGVSEANQRLSDQRVVKRAWPRVGTLHLVELYLDRASEAWRALQAMATAMPDQFAVDDVVTSGTGALRRPADSGYRGASYDLISAIAGEDGRGDSQISYTLDTKRARSEVRAQKTQGPLVRELIRSASNDLNQDRQVGKTLFNLLVPIDLETYLGGTTEMLIELDSGTAGIPWELLDTNEPSGGGGSVRKPWALRSKLLRKLRIEEVYRDRVKDAGAGAAVLVIGEPQSPDPAIYPRLSGARKEANAVADLLRQPAVLGSEDVHTLISPDDERLPGPDASKIINALMERPWRIVHIAGHGEPPQSGSDPRGVVLSSGIFLGPREIENMRVVPELVFVNCCHLAARDLADTLPGRSKRVAYDRAQFAASVAEALIKIGVRCVIAAGWAVEDEPAMTFATTFYKVLLSGRRFMDAVAAAREAACSLDGSSNTWAAYQCYGDPDWYFQRDVADAQRPSTSLADEFAGISSAPGLALALETLAIRSTYDDVEPAAKAAKNEEVRARLRFLEARFASKWASMGAVAEAFGVAWDAAGDRVTAIRWLNKAASAHDGSATMKVNEHLANLQVRVAEESVTLAHEAGHADGAEIDKATRSWEAALATLIGLAAVQPTMERLSLIGSAYKRRAMMATTRSDKAGCLKALADMEQYYKKAEERGREEQRDDVYYPAVNRIAAQLALARLSSRMHKTTAETFELDTALVESLRRQLSIKTRDDPDFWSVVGVTDLRVLEALAHGDLATQKTTIMAEYASLRSRVSSTTKWDSVADQMHLLVSTCLLRAAAPEKLAGDEMMRTIDSYSSRPGRRASPASDSHDEDA